MSGMENTGTAMGTEMETDNRTCYTHDTRGRPRLEEEAVSMVEVEEREKRGRRGEGLGLSGGEGRGDHGEARLAQAEPVQEAGRRWSTGGEGGREEPARAGGKAGGAGSGRRGHRGRAGVDRGRRRHGSGRGGRPDEEELEWRRRATAIVIQI